MADDLAAYERRLAKEQEENARLESRLRVLQAEAEEAEARFTTPQPVPTRTKSGSATNGAAAQPAASTIVQQLQALQASIEAATQQNQDGDTASVVSATRGRNGMPSSNRSVVSQSGRSVGGRSASGRSVGGRSTSQSSVRQGTGGRSVAVANTATASVVYRSSIYRPVSPSKKAVGGVVLTNFGRAPRFSDAKSDVPGPGKYEPHSTDFAPVAVSGGMMSDGNLGHTWSLYNATMGKKPTAAQEHYNAMAAATARIRSPEPMNRSGAGNGLDALSPGTIGSSASNARPGSTPSFAQHGDSLEAAVHAMVDAHHGDARVALRDAIRRERALRAELTVMRGNSNSVRMNAGQQASVLHNEMEMLRVKLERKDKSIAAANGKLKAWSDIFARADQTIVELSQWMSDAQAASGRNPALLRASDAVRALQAVLFSATSLTVMGEGGAGGQSMGEPDGASVAGGGGYMAYSSLSSALVNPTVGSMGNMGASGHVVSGQVAKQRAVAAAPPPPPARDRGLTSAQAAGLGLDFTAARGTSAADIQANPGQSEARTGISAADIRAFARSATGAAKTPGASVVAATRSAGATAPSQAEPQDAGAGSEDGSSITARLQALYSLYCGPYPGLRSPDFLRLLSDAGAIGDAGEGIADAEGAFARASASAAGKPVTAFPPPGEKLAYDTWIVALTDFACRRHNILPSGSDPAGLLVSPQAFRKLLDSALLPLLARIRQQEPITRQLSGKAGPSSPSPSKTHPTTEPDELQAMMAGFAEAFLRPDVLSFFNDYRAALQGLFSHYAGIGAVGVSGGNPTDRLNRRELLAFAADARLSPDMISKSQLLALVREVSRAANGSGPGSPGTDPRERDFALSYPEWCELLGLIAYVSIGPTQAQVVLRTSKASMLQKLQLLVLEMSHRGWNWPSHVQEIQRMIRGAEEKLRDAAAAVPPVPAVQGQAAQGKTGQSQGAHGAARAATEDATRAATRAHMARAMGAFA